MSIDVLDRLQMAILVCDHGAPNGGGPMGPEPQIKDCDKCNFYRDAADEIERLRSENRAVKDAYEHLAEISKSQRETMTKYLFPQEEQK